MSLPNQPCIFGNQPIWITQFRYIKIQLKISDFNTRLRGITTEFVTFISAEPRAEVCCFRLNFIISKFAVFRSYGSGTRTQKLLRCVCQENVFFGFSADHRWLVSRSNPEMFHYFRAPILVEQGPPSTWQLHTGRFKFAQNICLEKHRDLKLGELLTLLPIT